MYSASACTASRRKKRRKPAVIAGSCAHKCRSAMNSVLMQPRLLADGHAVDHHVFYRYVLVHAAAAGFHAFDLVDHVHAFNHFSKHAVAPALHVFAAEVQEVVVSHVDKKLCGGGVRIVGACHCQGADGVFQTVVGFVLDGRVGRFLVHARLETAALDHEAVDHTVEDGVVVETGAAVVQEVFNGNRRFVSKGLDNDIAVIGVESNHSFNPNKVK